MSKNNPLVSLIIPAYNDVDFISQCLDSVINQTYKEIEVIIVDDGSTDGTSELLDQYTIKDKRIHVYHKQNTGVSDTRNIGISMATGKYICFSDADDKLAPDYVEYLLNLIISSGADISLTTHMFGTFDNKQVDQVVEQSVSGLDAATMILSYRVPIGVYSKMFSAKYLKEKGIKFNTDLYIGEGFNFNFDSFQNAQKVIVSNRKIYFYRRDNPTSATTKFSMDKWINGLKAIDLIKKHMIYKTPALENAWNYAYWRTYSDVYDVMTLAKAQKDYPGMYKKCKNVVHKKAVSAFKANVSKQDRARALVMMVCPRLIPWAMRRRASHSTNVSTQ